MFKQFENEKGVLETIDLKEDQSALVYAGAAFTVAAGFVIPIVGFIVVNLFRVFFG